MSDLTWYGCGRYDNDAIRRPLRYVLDKLAMPLLGIFQTLLKLVDSNAANKDALEQVLKGAYRRGCGHVCPAPGRFRLKLTTPCVL